MATYEDIAKANASIVTTPLKGKEYAEVNQRIKAFRMVYPMGTIDTEMLNLQDGVVYFKATAAAEDGTILGTGHAYEKENSSFINKTSLIENCETSAVGRALGLAGFGIDTALCSADELSNALLNEGGEDPAIGASELKNLRGYAKEVGISEKTILATYNVNSMEELTMTQYRHATILLNKEAEKKKGSK